MNGKEIVCLIGLVLIILGVVVAPFGYWVHSDYKAYAIFLGIPGIFLFFYGLSAKETGRISNDESDIYPGKELRGFRGSDIVDDEAED